GGGDRRRRREGRGGLGPRGGPPPRARAAGPHPPGRRQALRAGGAGIGAAVAKKALVIVESPTKVKTIQKYLDGKYVVKASMGHVRDLPKSKLGVDEKKSFKPDYRVLPAKKKVLDELKKSASGAEALYIATDPDREGEA